MPVFSRAESTNMENKELSVSPVNSSHREKFTQSMAELRLLIKLDKIFEPENPALEPLQYLFDLITRIDGKLDIVAVDQADKFQVQNKNTVVAIDAAGGYMKTKLNLDMTGWQMIDPDANPDTAAGWISNWQWCIKSNPNLFEIVVVKYPDGLMHVDWVEPNHYYTGKPNYSNNVGCDPQFWMPIDKFLEVAPAWAQDACVKLPPEKLMGNLTRWWQWRDRNPE